jgi:HK97 family phage prohead protease
MPKHTRKRFDSTTKASKTEARTIVATISTPVVDRDGDVVLPSGLDAKAFKKNPVVLFGHDNWSMPIGKVTRLRNPRSGVEATIKLADRPESHPPTEEWVPDTILELFDQGILNAFSIGFIVKDGGWREATTRDVRQFGDNVRRVITNWELLELSVVPVPANQEALAMAVSKGICDADSWVCRHLEVDKPEPLVRLKAYNPVIKMG